MKKTLLVLTVITSLAIAFSSCKRKDTTGLLIPKDAAIAVHINSASLLSKLSWEEIKISNWFQKLQQENPDSLLREFLSDPAGKGIDMKSDFVLFATIRTNGAYLVANGKLKDDAAFTSFCKKVIPDGSLTQEGTFSFISHQDQGAVVWNKERYAIVINLPGISKGRSFENESPAPEYKSITADSLKIYGKKVLSLSNTETLGTDEHFADLIHEPGDIHYWQDIGKLYAGYGEMGQLLSMMKLSSFVEGNKFAMTVNFENGKILMSGKQYHGEAMAKLLKKYPFKPVDASLVKRLPTDNVMAAFAINFQPEFITALLKAAGIDGLINLFLEKSKFKLEDITKANKGQVLFALTGFDTKKVIDSQSAAPGKKPELRSYEEKVPKFIIANAINDKEAFERLFSFFKESDGKIERLSSGYTFRMKDDWFAAGDSANVAAFLSGNTNSVPFADFISGHPFGGFIDFQKIIDQVPETEVKDSSKTVFLNASKNMWQNVIMNGGDFSKGAVSFSIEINLVNKESNSLKQLNQYLDQISKAYQDHLAGVAEKTERVEAKTK